MKSKALLVCGLCFLIGSVSAKEKGATMATNSDGSKHAAAPRTELSKRILKHDLGAVELADKRGGAALPELAALLDEPDAKARTITVMAIGAMRHSDSIPLLFRSCLDKDPTVAVTAAHELRKYETQLRFGELIKVLDQIQHAPAKSELILLMGMIGMASDAPLLQEKCKANTDADVQLSCNAALARMGLESARSEGHRPARK